MVIRDIFDVGDEEGPASAELDRLITKDLSKVYNLDEITHIY